MDQTEFGHCTVRQVFGDLWIIEADERIRISEEVLQDAQGDNRHPDLNYGDGIFTIRARNGTVSYGVGRADPFTRTREARLSPGSSFGRHKN